MVSGRLPTRADLQNTEKHRRILPYGYQGGYSVRCPRVVISWRTYPERRRGNWPEDAPGNLADHRGCQRQPEPGNDARRWNVDRRVFLFAAGAALPLWLFPFSRSLLSRPSRRGRDEPPLRGLSRCGACGDWQGVVVDPDHSSTMASCRCRPSRCGRCGEVVHPRRICGHYWCDERRALIHVPWFVGMGHACRR